MIVNVQVFWNLNETCAAYVMYKYFGLITDFSTAILSIFREGFIFRTIHSMCLFESALKFFQQLCSEAGYIFEFMFCQ